MPTGIAILIIAVAVIAVGYAMHLKKDNIDLGIQNDYYRERIEVFQQRDATRTNTPSGGDTKQIIILTKDEFIEVYLREWDTSIIAGKYSYRSTTSGSYGLACSLAMNLVEELMSAQNAENNI